MNFGISTACYYPLYTELAVKELAEHDVKNIEIFVNTSSELKPAYAKKLKQILDHYGMKAISVHPFTSRLECNLFFSDYYRRFLDGIELYQKYFDFMEQIGAKILVFHGNYQESPFPDESYFERYGILQEEIQKRGLLLAQENVYAFKSHSLDFLVRMKQALHNQVHFVLDIKQAYLSKQDIFSMVDQLGEQIIHLHVSDHRSGERCLPIGKGDFDFATLFQKMEQKQFDGYAMLELYRHNYQEYDELYDSLKRLQQIDF